MASIIFQGSSLENCRLDPEINDVIRTLVNKQIMEKIMAMDIDNLEVCEQTILFKSVKLPDRLRFRVPREISCKTVILADETSWDGLESVLNVNRNLACVTDLGLKPEIICVSWPNPRLNETDSNQAVKASYLLNELDRNSDIYSVHGCRLLPLISANTCYTEGDRFVWIDLDEKENVSAYCQFKQLCATTKELTFHWLEAFSLGFAWRKSCGSSMSSITTTLTTMVSDEGKWLQMLNDYRFFTSATNRFPCNNIICISGVAGMGKTEFLKNITFELKKKYANRLVCYINLQKLSSMMMENEQIRSKRALNFRLFLDLLAEYYEIIDDVEREVLKSLFSLNKWGAERQRSPRVELLLDGLDQMNQGMVKVLLKFLKNDLGMPDEWYFRVWISTRPHLQQKLEKMFLLVAFELESLGGAEISKFLKSKRIPYADEVVSDEFARHLKLDVKGLLSIPARMRAFEQFLDNKTCEDLYKLSAIDVMNVIMDNVKFYYRQTIADKEYSKYEKHIQDVIRLHFVLARQTFSTENTPEWVDPIWKSRLLSFGLVTCDEGNDNDKVSMTFVHEAYIHYAIAYYYTSRMPEKFDFETSSATILFLKHILYEDDCEPIRLLYSQLQKFGMSYEVADSWNNEIQTFLIETYHLSDDSYDHGKIHVSGNLLQLAIIDQDFTLAKLILRSFPSSKCKELRRLIESKVKVEMSGFRSSGQECPMKRDVTSLSRIKYFYDDDDGMQETCQFPSILTEENWTEMSSLSLAAMFGDLELLQMLYKCLDVEGESQEGEVSETCRFLLLHFAVIGCNLKTLPYLTRFRRKSANKTDSYGHTPLHLSFYNEWTFKFFVESVSQSVIETQQDECSFPVIVEPRFISRQVKIHKYYNDYQYIDLGFNTNYMKHLSQTPDRSGHFPLLTSDREDMPFLKMQMKNGHDFLHKDCPRKIVHYNNIASYLQIVEKLTGVAYINYKEVSGEMESPFHMACAQGYLPIVECMVAKHANINIKDKNGLSSLPGAVLNGHVNIVKYLEEKGLSKEGILQVINGAPVIHQLSSSNHSEMLAYLGEELRSCVNMKWEGKTPLHFACERGRDKCWETAKVLIEMGADINARDDKMMTPLMYGCWGSGEDVSEGSFKLIKLLIEKGAEVNAQMESGESALHYLVLRGNAELLRHFMASVGGGGQLIVDLETTKIGEGIKGQTPLHFACKQKGNVEILKCLIERKANVNKEDSLGQTPILLLFKAETEDIDEEMAEFLVKQNAFLYKKSLLGQMPFDELMNKDQAMANRIYDCYRQMVKERGYKLNI